MVREFAKCTRHSVHRPAMRVLQQLVLAAFTSLAAAPLAAQTTLRAPARLLHAPGGRLLAELPAGSVVRAGAARGAFTQVTLEGFVHQSMLGGARDSFAVSVGGSGGVRLRAQPSLTAPVLAAMQLGMGLSRVERRGEWVRVRRTGWISSSAIATAAAPPRTTAAAGEGSPPKSDSTTQPDDGTPLGRQLTAIRELPLRSGPGGRTLATLARGIRLTPVARERGWVRVRLDGWVPESDVLTADTSLRAALSAADLRADPAGTRGKLVRWNVQSLAFQLADPLRGGLHPNEPYLLARGPDGENALLYLALPPSLVEQGRALPPLAEIVITARVRDGRSPPVGVPVLEVEALARR